MKPKVWYAYRIKGAKAEQYAGVIVAKTEEEATREACKVFNATTALDKARVYVRERQ